MKRAEWRNQQMAKKTHKRRYISGIDGLRTLAVIGVIVFHLAPSALQGGFLGVPIFLVLAGYLVTYFMLLDWDNEQSLHIGAFLKRRISRLYPTLVTVLVATTAYITLFNRSLLTNIKATLATNLTFVYNWFEIGHGQSYFDRAMGESPFTHLWTLSLEGQFYLIWPFVIILLLKLTKKRWQSALVLLVGAIASAIEMAILYDPNNINRVYYGTDTRFFALLLGASLAFIWPIHKLSSNVSKGSRWTFDGVGLLLMLGMIYYYITMSGSDAWAYHGGMFIFSLLATLFVAIIVHPASHWNQWLTNPVFTYIGKRSYGIYVYQFPVMIFYENSVKSIGNHPLINALIQVAIILVISELSYRYVEKPLNHMDWHQLGTALKNPTRVVTAAIMAAMVALTFVGMATKPEQSTADSLKKTITARQAAADKKNQRAELLQKKQAAQAKKFAHNRKLEKQAIKHLSVKKRKVMKSYGITAQEMVTLQHTPLTSVGDSVMIDISGGLQQLFPGAVVDGQVGRQMDAAQSIVQQMANSGKISDNLLLNLGTNGTVTSDQVKAVMGAVGPKRDVYWTTAYVPNRSWQNEVNSTIISASKKYKNLHIIDWYSLAKKHPGWFTSDGIHPNNTGVHYFAKLIAKSIAKDKN
ncbi:acyltransferase family protein [Lentilactobacillus senioris]|uniref:acyltransferase family protein n=1 Tax=Lentilactobacillus senioris TaxID=931534 RepID=UPI00228045C4|nr:acyltransferase family protein [Lentilactobacillus senioris]MCY9807381.1 acyltransferase family protein [Lentilactobacillus senioris]